MAKPSNASECRSRCQKREFACMESYKTPAHCEQERSRCETHCDIK
jgi:hypothetical protein